MAHGGGGSVTSSTNNVIGSFQIILSNATRNDDQAIKLHDILVDKGYTVFQQQTDRFSKDASDWQVRT